MSKQITEEMNLHEQWYADAKRQTLETLPAFLQDLASYGHDYGTICHALGAAAVAAANAMNHAPCGGITGFQAGFVMWGFVRHWKHESNKCGMRLVDYDNMLYPQYESKFVAKTITPSVWKAIQEQAQANLDNEYSAHPDVIAHWKSIVRGKVPFGYKVRED